MSELVNLNRYVFSEPNGRLQVKLFPVIFLLRERDSTDRSFKEEHLPIFVVFAITEVSLTLKSP